MQKLKEKGVRNPCSRCNGLDFEVISNTKIVVPAAVIECSNCGDISLHALVSLGLVEIDN